MLYRGKTLKEAISRAAKQQRGPFDHAQKRRHQLCQSLAKSVEPIQRDYDRLTEILNSVNDELDAANRRSGNNNLSMVVKLGALITRARSIRALFRVLSRMRDGQFNQETADAIRDVFDILEDIRILLASIKQATQEIDEWGRIQSDITEIHTVRRSVWDQLRRLQGRFLSLGCQHLDDPNIQMS